jgi:hypothetical protein
LPAYAQCHSKIGAGTLQNVRCESATVCQQSTGSSLLPYCQSQVPDGADGPRRKFRRSYLDTTYRPGARSAGALDALSGRWHPGCVFTAKMSGALTRNNQRRYSVNEHDRTKRQAAARHQPRGLSLSVELCMQLLDRLALPRERSHQPVGPAATRLRTPPLLCSGAAPDGGLCSLALDL